MAVLMSLFSLSGIAQNVYLNQFTGASSCPTPGNVPTVAANATGTALTRNLITCTPTANVFNSTTLNNTSSINPSSYIEFTVTPDAGYGLSLSSLSFFRQGSNTAPNQLEVRYSTDNFTTSTSWGAAPLSTNPGSVATWDFPDFVTTPGQTLSFRFYPYGTQRTDLAVTPSATTGTLRLDDITLVGNVIPVGPFLLFTPGSQSFANQNIGTQSASQIIQISGDNLSPSSGTLSLSVSNSDFEVSNDDINWGASTSISYGTPLLAATPVYVRFSPQSAGALSATLNVSGGGVSNPPTATLNGTGTNPAFPTQLVITNITPASPIVTGTFDVTIEARDGSNIPQNVISNTDIQLSVVTGTGTLVGTSTGTMNAGTNTLTISGVNYNVAENGVVISADRINGDLLTSGSSAPFNVLAVATQLSLLNFPTSGVVLTNLSTFTVQALRPDNSVDVNYTGPITITINSGVGTLSGTVTKNAFAGIASFNDLQLNPAGTYTLEASSPGLNPVISGNLVIANVPTISEIILPQYAVNGGVTGERLQYVCRLQVQNLIPNATYRYYTGASTATSLTTTAPGNFYAINNTSGSNGYIVGQSSAKSANGTLMGGDEFVTTNRYAEFTADTNGEYTGWFSMVPTGNAVFADGNDVYFYVQMNNGSGGTSLVHSVRTSNTIKMIVPSATARAVKGASNAIAENPVFLYDNTGGSGRPVYGTWAESDGISPNYTVWYNAGVNGVAGSWGAYIPTNLPNGIQRIEQRDIVTGNVLGCAATDSDGIWAGAGNTVNPTNGITPIGFSITDAPLDALPLAGTASGPGSGNVNDVLNYSNAGFVGNLQWQVSTTSATGPWSDISGETSASMNYTFNAAGTFYFQCVSRSASGYCEAASNVITTTIQSANTVLNLTMMIQGFYDINTSGMQPVLLNQSVGGALSTEADDITVSLHDAVSPYNMVYTFSGRVGTNGQLVCNFPGSVAGNSFYIVLTHRNSLETWSAIAIAFTANTSYSFVTSAAQAYGSNQTDVSGTGIFAIYNGDVNQDDVVDGLDFNDWETDNNNFAGGFVGTDFNGDGIVDGLDFLIWEPNNNNFVGAVLP